MANQLQIPDFVFSISNFVLKKHSGFDTNFAPQGFAKSTQPPLEEFNI